MNVVLLGEIEELEINRNGHYGKSLSCLSVNNLIRKVVSTPRPHSPINTYLPIKLLVSKRESF